MILLIVALVLFFAFYVDHMRRELPSLRMPFWMSFGIAVPWVTGVLYVVMLVVNSVKG